MKKLAISVVSILAVVVMCFSLAACGAAGTYKFYSFKMGDTEYKAGDTYTNLQGKEEKIPNDYFELVLENEEDKDGNKACTLKTPSSTTGVKGTWKEDKDGNITFNGLGISNVKQDGNKLVFTYDFGLLKWEVTLKK